MNEKLQYATMLEIPVNTCNITYKPSKKRLVLKRKTKNPEAIKEKLLLKVNAESERQAETAEPVAAENFNVADIPATADSEITENFKAENTEIEVQAEENKVQYATVHKKTRKLPFKFTVITAEVAAIFALIAIIFLTNAIYPESAMNVFMKRVFAPSTVQTSREKEYFDFAPVMNFNGEAIVSDGVISFSGGGSVYAPLDGEVASVVKTADGTYTMTVAHSEKFCSVISGLSYAYLGKGDRVYGNIPVGYVVNDGLTMCFNAGDSVITDYTLENNSVLWAV